jgi:uncharacterized membrane protein
MTASLFLHLLAAMFWIGGMAFTLYIVRPAAIAALQQPQRVQLTSAVMGRFTRLVTIAVPVLLATGLHLIFAMGGFGAVRPAVHIMFGGALVMFAIFGYVAHGCYPKVRRHVEAQEWPAAGALLERIRKLVMANLALGVLIVAAVKFM